MDAKAGIFRRAEDMKQALDVIRNLKNRFRQAKSAGPLTSFNYNLLWLLELGGNLDVAEIIVLAHWLGRKAAARIPAVISRSAMTRIG